MGSIFKSGGGWVKGGRDGLGDAAKEGECIAPICADKLVASN